MPTLAAAVAGQATSDRRLTVERKYTSARESTLDPCGVEWKLFHIEKPDMKFSAPADWSVNAVKVLATKYARKSGVPLGTVSVAEDGVPEWLWRSVPADGVACSGEDHAEQIFSRIAGCWTYWGWKLGYFQSEGDAKAFYDEWMYLLVNQIAAPASPQWFNTGLHWAYGIMGPNCGQWSIALKSQCGDTIPDPFNGDHHRKYDGTWKVASTVQPVNQSYTRVAASACFILSVKDSLVGPGGITDGWGTEARVFKFGGGAGSDFSKLRGEGEPLSGGGVSSGYLSFAKVSDAAAQAIKSAGTTRRAAKMNILHCNHPDIEKFIDWKEQEEYKVACLAVGSHLMRNKLENVYAERCGNSSLGFSADALSAAVSEAIDVEVPFSAVNRAISLAEQGKPLWPASGEYGVPPLYNTEWQGEAYATVSGQNANNSVRVTGEFLIAVRDDLPWNLIRRTDGSVHKTISARRLWDRIAETSWSCADPGVQYDDSIQEWNTCSADGRINGTNPCSEYMFLDDTACNLLSANLVKFARTKDFDLEKYQHVARLMTVAGDITVTMGAYPTQAIAEGSRNYRTLGIGYSNLGALLMRSGIAYDSDEGRAWAGLLTAALHFTCIDTSADLAEMHGPFPRYIDNREAVNRVIHNHCVAVRTRGEYRGLSVLPMENDLSLASESLSYAVRVIAAHAINKAEKNGVRNAQWTLLAPTGTISILMDCDTYGCEPEFSLVRHKKLAGGGSMVFVNQSVTSALKAFGLSADQRKQAGQYIEDNNTIEGWGGGVLSEQELAVFDCASSGGGTRSVSVSGHLKMMASIQPFLSGAISKTINMPEQTTIKDVRAAHDEAAALMLKAIAICRDGSKLSLPVTLPVAKKIVIPTRLHDADLPGPLAEVWSAASDIGPPKQQTVEKSATRPVAVRSPLPNRRRGDTQKMNVGGMTVYLRTGEYPDGKLGEIFLDVAEQGTDAQTSNRAWARAVSIGLQHGVPLEAFVKAFAFTHGPGAGPVHGHARLKMSSSLLDAVARDIGIHYLGLDELAHVQPDGDDDNHSDADSHIDDQAVHEKATEPADITDVLTGKVPLEVHIANRMAEKFEAVQVKMYESLENQILNGDPTKGVPVGIISEVSGQNYAAAKQEDTAFARRSGYTGDVCRNRSCGSFRVRRSGTCVTCEECGENSGCS